MKEKGRKDKGVIRRYEGRRGIREEEKEWKRRKKVDESKQRR